MPKSETTTWYLTFDDGPSIEITEWVLDILNLYGAKATFFCLGHNVEKHPEVYQRILSEGHTTGNHSYSHLNSWRSSKKTYLEDIQRASKIIKSPLFRPPFGRLKWGHYCELKKNYSIIFWTKIAWDWTPNLNAEKKANQLIKKLKNGDVIVLHDNIISSKNLKIILPIILQHAKAHHIQLSSITY